MMRISPFSFGKKNDFFSQFFRYCFAGSIATLADTTLVIFLTKQLGMYYLFATTIGFFVGLIIIYIISIFWIFPRLFKRKKGWKHHAIFFFGFGIVGIGGLFLSLFFMWLFYEYLSFSLLFAKLSTVFLVLWWNFLARRTIVTF